MTIKVWQSFSCNNSTSYRLVARFAEPLVAAESSAEFAAFLAAHAKEVRESKSRLDESYAALELADKYGLDPDQIEMFGVAEISEIEVAAIDDTMVIYHDYCLGFGEAFRGYLQARGAATINQNANTRVELSALFDMPDDAALAAALDALIAQNDRDVDVGLTTPWQRGKHGWRGRAAVFRDAGTVGIFVPITPDDLAPFRDWLAAHGVSPVLRLCQPEDWATFRAIGKARCTACHGPLKYLDPRLHDIEHPQLVCNPCGGLYELSTFLEDA